jgi:hypothetical protein
MGNEPSFIGGAREKVSTPVTALTPFCGIKRVFVTQREPLSGRNLRIEDLLQAGRLQRFPHGNNTPAFIFRDRKESSITGDEEVGFGCKSRSNHDIVVWIGREARDMDGPDRTRATIPA